MREGECVGPYELQLPVGAGGMGEVWKDRDKRLDRIVAIKFPHAQISEDTLSPAAEDASGRVLVEVDSDGLLVRARAFDRPAGFHGDVWMPGWESNRHIAGIGVRLDSTLWKYSPLRTGSR